MDRVGAAEVSVADGFVRERGGSGAGGSGYFLGKIRGRGNGLKPEQQTYASDERTCPEMTSWHRVESLGGQRNGLNGASYGPPASSNAVRFRLKNGDVQELVSEPAGRT